MLPITQEEFGHTKDGRLVVRFTLSNKNGMVVKIINFGAAITSILVPDKAGNVSDVALGHEKVEGYEACPFFFGIVAGRCANRIAKGRFTIDGQEYQLETNNGPNHLHGGFKGFGVMLWNASVEDTTLKLTYVSPDGDQSYPGELITEVTYQLTDENALNVAYSAVTTKPTLVNLTQHSCFNLAGHDAGTIYQHKISIDADHYIPVNDDRIPTGEVAPVQNTVFDLREPVDLDRIHDVPGGGYDHTFCLNSPNMGQPSIKVVHPASGRSLEMSTNQPGVQFYSGNFLGPPAQAKQGVSYPKHGGFCLETGNYPNAVNQPNFPNVVLRPGEKYHHTTSFKFSW